MRNKMVGKKDIKMNYVTQEAPGSCMEVEKKGMKKTN